MRKTLRAALAALLAFTLLPTASLTAIAGEMGTLAVGDAVALPPQFTLDLSDATYSSEAATRFYVRAESTDGGYLTYQWHRSGGYDAPQAGAGDGGAADAAIKTNPINFAQGEGGTSSVLSAAAPAVEQTTYFYYWVTVTNHRDANGNGTTDELGESTAKDSALACVKVVNRTLEPKLMNGDFQSFNHAWMGTDTGNSSGHWSSPAVDIPADKTIVPYWNTTHDGSYSTEAAQKPVHNGKVMEIQRAGVGGVSQGLSTEGHGPTPNSVIYDQTAGSYPLIVELSAAMKSSIYQDIATVPGKIYEWSIDFAAPSSDNLTEMVAVVIGPALNEESDYQSDVTDHWTGPVTYTLSNGSGNNFKCIQPGTYTWTYPYGVNTDTFFQDIVLAAGVPVAATEAGAANDTLRQSLNGTTYAVPYNGSTYYVKLVSDVGGNGVWTQGAGSYTVPSGQGTTVFGFASVFAKNANGGNLLDNIVFSSGTDLDAKQNLTYAGETSLSAPTQDGFAYALAEIRGSSVNELVGLNATYKPEGGSEVAVAPTPGLGAGWYATHGEGSSFSTGTITFKDLVPGKTYRIIGIPKLAINTGLHTNESPGNVLDEGYYKDVRIQPTFGGSDEDGAQALPAWQVELYTQAGVGARTRVTLLHSNAGSEYALLAGNQDAPYTPATPALAGTAPEGSGWSVGTGSNLAFEGLPVNNSETVYYWLVSRPAGYTEVGYSDAAWPQGQTGPLGALPISVPPNFADDLDAAFVSRSPHGTSITIAAGLGGAQNGYEYALADVQSGRLIGNPIPYIDSAITFNNLQPLLDYQVVRRASNAGWLRGVRVFRAPQNLMVDYVNASVISTAPEATGGFIPADVEYSVRANTGQTPTWLVGGADTWVKATGSERLELAESGVVTAEGFSDTSILGALDALGNATDATVRYRLASVGDYVGPAVLPELELAVPLRPAAPVVGALAGSADFALDWAGEKIKVGPKALEWRADGLGAGTDAAYTPLAAGAEVGFAELGWTGAADRTVVMRFEAFAATDQTPGAFASHDSAPTVLEARPDVPENLYALLKNSEAPEQGIEMRNLIAGRAYQYRYTSESAGSLRQWQELTATGTVATLPFALGYGDCQIRYAALPDAGEPASFYATVSLDPLTVAPLNLGTMAYGSASSARNIIIRNIDSNVVTLPENAVQISDTEHFTLTAPAGGSSVPAVSNDTPGVNQAWTLAPKADIPAGSYIITVTVSYSHESDNYTTSANVYLTVTKADWDVSNIEVGVMAQTVLENSFTVTVSGVPTGARLSFQAGSGEWSAPEEHGIGGIYTHSFTELKPATSYPVHVHVEADANHNATTLRNADTGHTAQAKPVAAEVLHIDYGAETLRFASGYSTADYRVYLQGLGGDPDVELFNLDSLTERADAGFTLYVERRAQEPYRVSVPDFLVVAARAAAPTDITTTRASDDRSADGTIALGGLFQYRASRNGADLTNGWTSGYDLVRLSAGRYEVRRPPTDTAFASRIETVTIESAKPVVILRTRTYLPAGAGAGNEVVPSYLMMPAGWTPSTDPAQAGRYDRAYLTSPLDLPPASEIKSASHVFLGWYGSYEGAPTEVQTQTPTDNPIVSGYEYRAKWAIRPSVSTVAGAEPERDPQSVLAGLAQGDPVKLTVELPADKNTLALADIVLAGQSTGTAATLYSDAGFSQLVSDELPLTWAGEAGHPTRAWLKTVSADDTSVQIYYELTLKTTRKVSFTAVQEGGTAGSEPGKGVKTSSSILITFDDNVEFADGLSLSGEGVPAADAGVVLADGSGHALAGKLSDAGDEDKATYRLALSDVAAGDVILSIADWAGYDVDNGIGAGSTEEPQPQSARVALYRDATPPTATVTVAGNPFTEFLNAITFGLFFNETVDVSIAAADTGGDGVASVEYLKLSADTAEGEVVGFADADAAKAATDWAAYTPFSVEPNEKFIVYARVTDNAGNISVVGSDGVVVYTQSAAVTGTLHYTRLSGEDALAQLRLKGNTVAGVALVGEGAEGSDLALEEGTDYTVSALEAGGDEPPAADATLTLKAAWLEDRAAGNYQLEVSYKPLGEDYDEAAAATPENDAPETSMIALEVHKVTPEITLAAEPADGTAYATNNVTLRAFVADPGPNAGGDGRALPSGTVTFYKDGLEPTNRLNSEPLSIGEGGTTNPGQRRARLDITLETGTHQLYAVYTGDENYAGNSTGSPAIIENYEVEPAEQGTLMVREGAADGNLVTNTLDKRREDRSFKLYVSGGAVGNYIWASNNAGVAEIASSAAVAEPATPAGVEATITIKAAGSATLTVYREGDTNHNDSAAYTITLTVAEESTRPIPGGAVIGEGKPDAAVSVYGQPTTNAVTLKWDEATDKNTFTADDDLVYYVYYSTDATNDISTPEDCVANGTLLNGDAGGHYNLGSFAVTELEPNTAYWFNVVVEDEAENRAAYKAVRAVTRLDVNLSTAAQQGGKNGRNATSGILITFDQAVTGLTSDSVTVSGALVKAGAVTPVYSVEDNQDAGALSPTASWLVPVALVSGAVNGDKAQISVASWTNSGAQGDGHGYNVTNSATSFEVTAYKPVQQPTPTAYIDYENMWIRGLVPGGTYAFATTDTPFGGERTIDLSGDLMGAYPIPFGRFDTQLSIKRIGVPAGELPGLDDDDEGYLDSEVQTFAVPARPVAPSVNVASPTTPGGKGSVEVSGLAAGTSADLTTMAEFLAHNPQEDGYDDTMWTHSTPAGSDGKVTFSDLAPGAYYVRAKAKQPAGTYTGTGVGGLFPSPATFFLVYNPDETGLGSVLEGYSVDDGEAESVTNAHSIAITAPEAEEGHTTHAITGVSWVDADGNPASDPQNTNLDVNGYFIISGNAGTNFAIAPVPNLRPDDDFSPKTYTARLKVDYAITVIDDTGDDTTATFYRDITFTVHPHAAFAADDGAVLSSVDTNDTPEVEDDEEIPGGLTNTLTLTFAYPTYLEYANVVVGGAVTKTSSATGFRSVSVDQTTYVLDVTVNTASKTGDPASVTIPLDRNNHYYAEQVKAFGNEIHTQTDGVKIPRALKSAQAMAAVPGQATGIIQFELDDDYTPLNPADALLWSSGSPYTGPIELASAGDAGGAATIASVYRIEAGRDGQGNYWIFRAFITTTEAGPITLAIPSFDIGPIEVEGDLATGSVLGGAAYFLNHEGYNFYSNLDAFQVLNPVDAERGYVVPAIELPTSLEYTAGMNAEVYAWGPDGGDPVELEAGIHYTLSGGGPATFRFTETPGAYQSLANQLVLTLKEDWTHLPMTGGDPALNTRANGSYRLACVFGADEGGAGGAAAQAIFTIGDITPTYKLTVSDAPGGAGATARSERGWPTNTPTSEGYFAEGATVTLSAGTPEDGWRFASWLHTGGVTPVLPTEATGSITMLANELSVEAIYTDGTPPVTTIAPAPATEPGSYTWLNADSELTLTATDWDVETGAAGTVATIHYSIDSGQEQNYTVPFSLGADLAEGLHIIRYWSVDSKGNQESPKTATFGFDKTAPTATLHLRGVAYTAFDDSEGFTRFYRGDLPVQITDSDIPGGGGGFGPQADLRSSGVAKVEYLLSTTAYADTAALPTDVWTDGDAFILNYNWHGYIYARVSDAAGNTTVVRSDGIVRYTDAAVDTAIVNFTKTSTVDLPASVTLNGNSVAAITAKLAATEQGQPDTVVKLVVDQDYTVDNNTGDLSFKAAWLEGLAAGAWTLTIDYAPHGVSFNPDPVGGSDAPHSTNLTINVYKHAGEVELAVTPAGGTDYHQDNIVLIATVTGGLTALGTGVSVEFLASPAGDQTLEARNSLGSAPLMYNGTSQVATATLITTLGAGEHDLIATYGGNDTYLDAEDILEGYQVDKATQPLPVIRESEDGAALTELQKPYGEDFELFADGGAGTGAFSWHSSNSGVAYVEASTGKVAVIKTGSCTITLQRFGDDNHLDSPVASLTLTVSPRPVTLSGIAVKQKVYDGTDVAEIDPPAPPANTAAWIAVVPGVAGSGLVPGDANAVAVSYQNAEAHFVDANAGSAKQVVVSGFELEGPAAQNYQLIANEFNTTATITRATPTWDADLPQASGLSYGQSLAAVELTGTALGADGTALEGTLAFAPEVNTALIPGNDADSAENGLAAAGYSYALRFTPDDTTNYNNLVGNVAVMVEPAQLRMAGGVGDEPGPDPVGSTIHSNNSALPETLAASVLSGDVVISWGGGADGAGSVPLSVLGSGSWQWDDAKNGAAAAEISYPEGAHRPWALFVPSDPRLSALSVQADLSVFSPKTVIDELPAWTSASYGASLEDVAIADAALSAGDLSSAAGPGLGKVMAVAAGGAGGSETDITALGSWAWKNPETLLSTPGLQQAVLVFTPNAGHLADLSDAKPQGYLPVEVTVTVDVKPASPTLSTAGAALPISFGQPLSTSDLSQAGYRFSGVAAFGEEVLEGSFVWQDANIVPGGDEVRESGRYLAQAVFEPSESYRHELPADAQHNEPYFVSAYSTFSVELELPVQVSKEVQTKLDGAASGAKAAYLAINTGTAKENYDALAWARFTQAKDQLDKAYLSLSAGEGLPQAKGEALFAELDAALAGLKQDHPVLSHSAPSPVTKAGTGVTIVIKGSFADVASVKLNGKDFVLEPTASETLRALVFDGRPAGTLSRGSAIISLYAGFVSALENTEHKISVSFKDAYSSGSGEAGFTLAIAGGADGGQDSGSNNALSPGQPGAGAAGGAAGAAGAEAAVDTAAGTGAGAAAVGSGANAESAVDAAASAANRPSEGAPAVQEAAAVASKDEGMLTLVVGLGILEVAVALAALTLYLIRRHRRTKAALGQGDFGKD